MGSLLATNAARLLQTKFPASRSYHLNRSVVRGESIDTRFKSDTCAQGVDLIVTTMLPISAEDADPERPLTAIAVSDGPNSRVRPIQFPNLDDSCGHE
jgi:hypothetical protein